MSYYIKVTDKQISLIDNIIKNRVETFFTELTIAEKLEKNTSNKYEFFNEYTYYIEDLTTNDRYYRIENLKYNNIEYNFAEFIIENYPNFPRYDFDYVKQFLPVSEGT